MELSRREAIIGVGTLLAGAGAISSTGAFDTVSAERGVTVEFSADSDAVLGLGAAPDKDRDYLTVAEGTDGVVEIMIDDINRNARTRLDNVLAFTNNGDRPIGKLTVTLDDDSENAELLVHEGLGDVTIGVGETVVGLGLTIDTLNDNGHVGEPNVRGTLTIRAVTEYEES